MAESADRKTDPQRMRDFKALLPRLKPEDEFSLGDLAALWGVVKPRIVNKMKSFTDFPSPRAEGNKHFYPARESVQAMLDYLEGHQAAAVEKAKRNAKLLGVQDLEASMLNYTTAELVQLNRLQIELEQRAHDQSQYVAVSEVSQIAGVIFSEISEFMSSLSNDIDPHGKLDPGIRQLIDTKAHERLLKLHSQMKALLTDHVDEGTDRPAAGRSRKPRARRKR